MTDFVLKSRKIPSEEFFEDFIKTIKPGIIKRKNFIDWTTISQKYQKYKEPIEFYLSLSTKKASLETEIRDSLLSADNPFEIIDCGFQLLGHTQKEFVSFDDDINIEAISRKIQSGDQKSSGQIAKLFIDLGIEKVVTFEKISDYFFGIQVGLETHKRKNVGGEAFKHYVEDELKKTISRLNSEGYILKLAEEYLIEYATPENKTSQSKTVDFAILNKDKIKVGIEVNFYTNTGSKPTEIKRSYGEVNRKLNDLGIALVWVTDGHGYTKMRKSLKDAFEIHPNIYNFESLRKHFRDDLLEFLKK
jgi:type II restriction enzyme